MPVNGKMTSTHLSGRSIGRYGRVIVDADGVRAARAATSRDLPRHLVARRSRLGKPSSRLDPKAGRLVAPPDTFAVATSDRSETTECTERAKNAERADHPRLIRSFSRFRPFRAFLAWRRRARPAPARQGCARRPALPPTRASACDRGREARRPSRSSRGSSPASTPRR
jgi:hypothetical protein